MVCLKKLTNDDGDVGNSGSGTINDMNVQTITEEITLSMNGGVGNDDDEEVVYDMEKANDEDRGNIISLTEGATIKVLSGQRKLILLKTSGDMVEVACSFIVLVPTKKNEKILIGFKKSLRERCMTPVPKSNENYVKEKPSKRIIERDVPVRLEIR